MKNNSLHSVGLILIVLWSISAQATTYYVKTGGNNSSAGTSWSTAKADLQNALNVSSVGDEIWIAAGTYKPTLDPSTGTASGSTRDYSFYLDKNIEIYGGFAGTETLLSQRNSTSNPVILSGDINAGGTATNDCYHVFITEGLSSATVLDGITITGGKADGSSMIIYSGQNYYQNSGGGMRNHGSSPTLTDVTICGNTAANYGGGIFNRLSSSPTLTNVTISGNAAIEGGGMFNYASSPTLTNVTISGNTAASNGGGIYNYSSSSPTITNTLFWGNKKGTSSTLAGADIYNNISTTTISYSLVQLASSSYTSGNNNLLTANTNMVYATDPPFVNASDPDGADNVWMTADDGLNIYNTTPAYGVGTATGAPTTDIIGATRASPPSMGAYEGVIITRLYVDTDASGANNGSSWANAYTTLQPALNVASAGDSIWIAEGTYKPTLRPHTGTAGATTAEMRDQSFYLDTDIEIYGGFMGTETAISQRNSTSNPVILSGDIDASGNNDCYHVFITKDLSSAAVLDGVTITGGKANGSSTITYSGQNYYRDGGGGMCNYASSPTLTDVTISGNMGEYGGGIENLSSSSPTLTNVTISGNTATSRGGGMFIHDPSSTTLINVTISGNTAGLSGGGIDNGSSSSTTLTNVTISGNTAEYGGGMINYSSSPTLTNVTISGNTTTLRGGGMYNSSSSPTLTNVTICGNTASANGGGMYNSSSSSPTITNSLFWGNIKGTSSTIAGADIDNSSSSTATISYSLVQLASTSYTSGNNNLLTYAPSGTATGMVYATNPSFVNASDPDGADNIWMTGDDGLVLSSTSAGIGAGTSSSAPSYDITNKVRPTTPSIGAYEGKICKLSNNLPTVPATYTSSFVSADGSYTCYCDDNQNLILALDLNSTGAVVPSSGVSLEIGATTTTSWSTAGGIITNTNGGAIINRKWDVVPTTQPTSDVTVIYPFTHTEYGDVATALGVLGTTITNANQLEMYKLTSAGTFADPHASGATGVALPHGASASTSNWVWSQHGNGTDHLATYKVASFSGGGGGGGASGSPLPVELIHFDAQPAANHTADLHWATASETNNSHFEIERSYDGRTFETVGNVTGNGTTSQLIDYNYTDETIAKSQNTAYYRLKQVDYDGAYEYSDVRVVRFDGNAEVFEIAAYPNPFNNEVTIRVNAKEPYTIQVTDINGVVVLSVDHTESRTHRLDVSEYTAGVYIIEVTSTQGTKHLKVIKQ